MGAGKTSIVVHFENSYASGHKKRPRGPRSTPAARCTSKADAIPQRAIIDLKSTAVLYYLHYHMQPPNSTSMGVSDCFLPIWKSKAGSPLLDLAILSMALAVFSRTKQHLPAAIEASTTYHQLLKTLRATITSLDRENIDTCLLASFFMSRYENVVHNPDPDHLHLNLPLATTLRSFSHHDGALAVLKIWKDRLSHTKPATEVIKYTRRGLVRSALLRNHAIPEWMRDGALFCEDGLDLEYDCIVVRLANLRHRMCALLWKKNIQEHLSSSLIEELTNEAQHIDAALEDWAAHFPRTWRRQRHILPTFHVWPTEDFYSRTLYSYASPAIASVWNHYYATRILANSTRLRSLELARPISANEQRLECQHQINTMANDLASSLPFCLRRFKVKVTDSDSDSDSVLDQDAITLNTEQDIEPYVASLVVWQLGIAANLADVDVMQRSWFRAGLARLGRMVGDRVLEYGGTGRWLQL